MHGFAVAAENVLLPLIVVEAFGVAHMAQIYGALMFALLPGGALGPIFAARMYDTLGSYELAFTTFAVLNAVSLGLLCFVRAETRRYCATLNCWLATTTPFALISTLYEPAGQPSGFAMWNSVAAGPVGAIVCEASFTSWPPSYVQRAASVTLGDAPSRRDRRVDRVALREGAGRASPRACRRRSSCRARRPARERLRAARPAAGGGGAGGGASDRLQPDEREDEAERERSRRSASGCCMAADLLWAQSGILSVWPGLIRSGFLMMSLFASKIFFHLLASP